MPTLIPGWRRLLILLVPPLLALVALGVAYALRAPDPAPITAVGALSAVPALPPPAGLLVDVSGAVARPGLYRLQRGERVYAAIAAAGGLATGADTTKLPNLAGLLKDGEQVKVPFVKGSATGLAAGKVDINSATLDELAAVPGFTPQLAQDVVDYRARYGPVAVLTDLQTVLGMDKYSYDLAKKVLVVG